MQINKNKLLEAITHAMPAVSKEAKNTKSDVLLFKDGNIYAWSSVVAVSVPFDIGGLTMAVKGCDFFALISKMNSETLELNPDGNEIEVKGGRTKARFAPMEAGDMVAKIAAMRSDQINWLPIPEKFIDAVAMSSMSANKTPMRGCFINGGENACIIATDTCRIIKCDIGAPMETFWMDDDQLTQFLRMAKAQAYAVFGAYLHIKYEDGSVVSVKRKDAKQFPVNKILPAFEDIVNSPVKFKGKLPDTLKEVIERVSSLASTVSGEKSLAIQLRFTADGIIVYAKKGSGEAEELIPWPEGTDPASIPVGVSVWFDAGFAMEASQKASTFTVVEKAPNNLAFVFERDGYRQATSTCNV